MRKVLITLVALAVGMTAFAQYGPGRPGGTITDALCLCMELSVGLACTISGIRKGQVGAIIAR